MEKTSRQGVHIQLVRNCLMHGAYMMYMAMLRNGCKTFIATTTMHKVQLLILVVQTIAKSIL